MGTPKVSDAVLEQVRALPWTRRMAYANMYLIAVRSKLLRRMTQRDAADLIDILDKVEFLITAPIKTQPQVPVLQPQQPAIPAGPAQLPVNIGDELEVVELSTLLEPTT